MTDDRAGQIEQGLRSVRERIDVACTAAGRDPAEICLVVVTKTYPAADVVRLAELGVRDPGENRHPEGADKARACAEAGQGDLSWHFVGALQTNKAAAVAGYASWVHSVDRQRLITALDRGAQRAGRVVDCLVQVSLDPVSSAGDRSGAAPDEVLALADAVVTTEALRLKGVMGIAPLGGDAGSAFDGLAQVAAAVRQAHPDAGAVSAGMSGDLEEAISAGATHLRVGRAILGERAPSG